MLKLIIRPQAWVVNCRVRHIKTYVTAVGVLQTSDICSGVHSDQSSPSQVRYRI